MASQRVNILRYSALLLGIGYGINHQSSIRAREQHEAVERQKNRRFEMIDRAKSEFKRKEMGDKDGVISDPEHPNFDLEAYLMKAAESDGR